MANDPSPPPRGGLSLYANLLNPSATISAAPVIYKHESAEDDASKKQASLAASLRFQPTKRPQQNAAAVAGKAKAKALASKFAPPSDNVESKPEVKPEKASIADWAAAGSDDEWNAPEKRQRGGRKKRKKKDGAVEMIQNWDDVYDPSRPNSYEEYKHSEERIMEVREWKDLLYRHRMRTQSSRSESEQNEKLLNPRFAPPMSFAPPSNLNDEPAPAPAEVPDDPTNEDAYTRTLHINQVPPPPPDDATGNDAYTRRAQIFQPPPPPPPASSATITRAPVRYSLPPAPEEFPSSEAELQALDEPKSSRPGQAGFAQRLLSKYGWTKGSGLGAHGTGIINPLYAKVDKRKKKSDAEGGGFATPATTGKILGGDKSKTAQEEEAGKFGNMSEVIRLENMLDGMDLDEELTRGEGGIMQEIGEECGDKYGSVERVYIQRGDSPLVFVHFVSPLSALRAVNALEGRVFGGNAIAARFWPKEQFEAGEYE